jgi:hypothetical protein
MTDTLTREQFTQQCKENANRGLSALIQAGLDDRLIETDLDTLDMDDYRECALARVGGYDRLVSELFGNDMETVYMHGFSISFETINAFRQDTDLDIREACTETFRILTDVWKRKISLLKITRIGEEMHQ